MTSKAAAHAHPWKISDVVIFPLFGLGLFLEWLWPSGIPVPRKLGIGAGLAIAVCGFAIIQWSKRTLDSHNQPSLPEEPTTKLVKQGPFQYSRNPNYLGAGIAIFGGGIACNSIWVLGTGALSMLILDYWMIRPEERYLEQTFGAKYLDYKKAVRRWF